MIKDPGNYPVLKILGEFHTGVISRIKNDHKIGSVSFVFFGLFTSECIEKRI